MRYISCKRAALYINLMQAPHCFQQNGTYKDKLLFYKSWRDQIPSLFRRAWERGDNLAKSKRFPLLLLVSRSLKSSPFACHATTKERRTTWMAENVKIPNHFKKYLTYFRTNILKYNTNS